jgi:hypothetical protein
MMLTGKSLTRRAVKTIPTAIARLLILTVIPAVVLTVLVTVPAAAQAPPVPAAIYKGSASDPGSVITESGPGTWAHDYNSTINPMDQAGYNISLSGIPSPAVYAQASAENDAASASAQIFYDMEIHDSTSSTSINPVTVDISAYLSATSSANSTGGAVFQIEQDSGFVGSNNCGITPCLIQSWSACASAENPSLCSGQPTSLLLTTTESLFSNTLYSLEVSAAAVAPRPLTSSTIGTGDGSGFADPSFGIDSLTVDAGNYSFLFSEGIGNVFVGPPVPTSSVPEPGSLAVFGAALAGFGAMRSRKKRM